MQCSTPSGACARLALVNTNMFMSACTKCPQVSTHAFTYPNCLIHMYDVCVREWNLSARIFWQKPTQHLHKHTFYTKTHVEGNAITWLFDKKTLPSSAKTPAVTQEQKEKHSPKQQQTEEKHGTRSDKCSSPKLNKSSCRARRPQQRRWLRKYSILCLLPPSKLILSASESHYL